MDTRSIRAVRRVRTASALSGLFRRFLRWPALRDEGRLAAHRGRAGPPQFPQLVPRRLPSHVRRLPGRREINPDKMTPAAAAAAHSFNAEFAQAVATGLAGPGQKTLPPAWFYDEIGSALFEVITVLPEYGLTRAEASLLSESAADMVELAARPSLIIELGSGSGTKTRHIL